MPSKIRATKIGCDDAHIIDRLVVSDRNLDAAEFRSFLRGCKQRSFFARETIYHEGDLIDSVYAIRTGLVKLISHLPNGRARIIRLHGNGAWIGLGSVLNLPCEHNAVAIDYVNAYCIPVHKLLALKSQSPQEFFHLMSKWHEHLREADKWIAEFSTGAIKPRVARLITFLSEIEYGRSSGVVQLLTVNEMAEILGVTPESVSRILAEFKRDNILNKPVDRLPHEVYRFDSKMLRDLATA